MFYEIGLGGCWDLCAGALVLQEAGGRVLDPTGAVQQNGTHSTGFSPLRLSLRCGVGSCAQLPVRLIMNTSQPSIVSPACKACPSTARAAALLQPSTHTLEPRTFNPCIASRPLVAGAPFNLMSRRVLGTNAHLAEAAAAILAQCPDAPGEPPALPLPQ